MLESEVILAVIFVIFVAALLFWSIWRPLKYIVRIVLGMLAGGAAVFVINLVAGIWGYSLPLNPVSALLVGILGCPGLLVVIALTWLL